MKKLLLAVFAFSLAFSASADESDDVYDALHDACNQCQMVLVDNGFGAFSRCKSQVNLVKANMIANNPSLNKGRLKGYTCR